MKWQNPTSSKRSSSRIWPTRRLIDEDLADHGSTTTTWSTTSTTTWSTTIVEVDGGGSGRAGRRRRRAAAAAEEAEDEDEEVDDEDVEASLDEILKERLVVEEEEVEDEEVAEPDDRSEVSERVLPKQADEFVCSSCFLVKHTSQLADPGEGAVPGLRVRSTCSAPA